MEIRIGDNHIIRDSDPDDYSRRRNRVPTNFIRTNKDGAGKHICPDCLRDHQSVTMIYNKEMSCFICPRCNGMRTVNPLSKMEMQPGIVNPVDSIPSLDGLSESDAVARDLGKPKSKPMVRSIGNAHNRSQFASQSIYHSDNPFGADRETLEQVERMNGTLVDYKEYIPQDDRTVSSDELRSSNNRRARLEV